MTVRVRGTGITGGLVCVMTDGYFEPRAIIVPAGEVAGSEISVEVTAVEAIPGSFCDELDDLVLREAVERWRGKNDAPAPIAEDR